MSVWYAMGVRLYDDVFESTKNIKIGMGWIPVFIEFRNDNLTVLYINIRMKNSSIVVYSWRLERIIFCFGFEV